MKLQFLYFSFQIKIVIKMGNRAKRELQEVDGNASGDRASKTAKKEEAEGKDYMVKLFEWLKEGADVSWARIGDEPDNGVAIVLEFVQPLAEV